MIEISSPQNPLIKHIVELKSKSKSRKATSTCVVEGDKEIMMALGAGLELEKILGNADVLKAISYDFPAIPNEKMYSISSAISDKIAVRHHEPVAIFKYKSLELSEVALPENPFILVLENIEKPGNIGSLLRTADASGVDLVIGTDIQTDMYNPNVIRNSLGTVFSNKIIQTSNAYAKDFFSERKIQTIGSYLHTDSSYYQLDMKKGIAIIMGNEHSGISDFWVKNADFLVKIPMNGAIDSMNVSNAAAILMYEAVRQRLNT